MIGKVSEATSKTVKFITVEFPYGSSGHVVAEVEVGM